MRPTPRLRLIAALCAAAAIAGCGPGSGGTGTGSTFTLASAGATAANVCTSFFSTQLTCSADSTTAGMLPNDIGRGADLTRYADIASGGNVAVTFQSNSVQLQARCQRIAFKGDWGIVGASDARFFGGYVVETAGIEVMSSVSVQSLPGRADTLQIVLRETDGRVVLGPIVVQKVAAPVEQPAACP